VIEMPYLQDGKITQKAPWSVSIVPQMFWNFLNLIAFFFSSIFSDGKKSKVHGFGTNYKGSAAVSSNHDHSNPRKQMGTFKSMKTNNDLSDCGAGG